MSRDRTRPARLLLLLFLLAGSVFFAGHAVGERQEGEPTRGFEESNVTLSVWTGPATVGDDVETGIDLSNAIARRNLVRDRMLVPNDTVVLGIGHPGLEGDVRAADGRNTTTRFYNATDGEGNSIELVESTTVTSQLPLGIVVDDTGCSTVVRSDGRNQYFVLLDISECPWDRGRAGEREWGSPGNGTNDESEDRAIRGGMGFSVDVTVGDDSATFVGDGDGEQGAAFMITRPEVEFAEAADQSPVEVRNERGQTITAYTSYAPGTAGTVHVTNRSDGGPELRTETTVGPGEPDRANDSLDAYDFPAHSVTGRFDLHEVPDNATFDVRVAVGNASAQRRGVITNESVQPTQGTVTEPVDPITATPTDAPDTESSATESGPTSAEPTPTGPGFTIGTAIVAMAAALLSFRRSRRKR